ncbi:MAG: cobalamin biosynthesis protein CobD [Firmicutes bacterium]|nr:cobalamin biosynthesis protein CobD [Bacillota bacterium]
MKEYLEVSVISCVIGFLLDFVIGDPAWAFHPIRLIGSLISLFEKVCRRIFPKTKAGEIFAGFLLVLSVCFITFFTALFISAAIKNIYIKIAVNSLICCFMLAARSLKQESMRVYDKLKQNDIEGARKAVSMIVGRDTAVLDERGITKAAVETVAENLSDGVIAPMLYMMFFGSAAGVLYKAINTMDSMVGYKNDKYINFGKCAARLDDIVNFIPSRLSALLLILTAPLCGQSAKNALKIFIRDGGKHASPNSARTEAACAGAMGIQLAGDAYYFGKLYKKPFIGDDINEIKPEHIAIANKMMYAAAWLGLVIFAGIGVMIWI